MESRSWSSMLLLSVVIFYLCGAAGVRIASENSSKITPLIERPAVVNNRALNRLQTKHFANKTHTNDRKKSSDFAHKTSTNNREMNVNFAHKTNTNNREMNANFAHKTNANDREKSARQTRKATTHLGHPMKEVRSQLNDFENENLNPNLFPEQHGETNITPVSEEKEIFSRKKFVGHDLQYSPSNSIHSPFNSIHPPSNSIHSQSNSIHSPSNSIHLPSNSIHSPSESLYQNLLFQMKENFVEPEIIWPQFRIPEPSSVFQETLKFLFKRSSRGKNVPEKLSEISHEIQEGSKLVAEQVKQSELRPLRALLPLEKRAGARTLRSNLKHPFSKHASPKRVHLGKRSVYSTPSRTANDAAVGLVDGDIAGCGVAWTASSARFIPIYEAEMVDFFPARHENEQKIPSLDRFNVKRERSEGKLNRRDDFPSSSSDADMKSITSLFEERKPWGEDSSNYLPHTNMPDFAAGLPNYRQLATGIGAVAKTSRFPPLHSPRAQKLGKSHFSQVQKERASSKTRVRNNTDFAQQVPQLFPEIRGSEMEVRSLKRNRTSILVSDNFLAEDLRTKDALETEKFRQNEVKPFVEERQKLAEFGDGHESSPSENLSRTSSFSVDFEENPVTPAAETYQDNRHQSYLELPEHGAFDTVDLQTSGMYHSSLPRKMQAHRTETHGLQEKIIGGKKVMRGAFPWMAALVDKIKLTVVCGGTIVSQGWVLTAAHCALMHDRLLVSIGEHDVRRRTGREVYYEVKKVHIHEAFNPRSYDSDIALLHLGDVAVKVSTGSRKPPRNVANLAGIPVFSDPKPLAAGKKDKMALFNDAFSLWSYLSRCVPENGSLPEGQRLAYLKYLSLLFQHALENEDRPSSKPEICLPFLFVNLFATVGPGRPLPAFDHCSNNKKITKSKLKRFRDFFAHSLRQSILSVPSSNSEFDTKRGTEQEYTSAPNFHTSLFSNVSSNARNLENPIRVPIYLSYGKIHMLSTVSAQNNRRKPSESTLSAFQQLTQKCPPILPEVEIEHIIEPRNSNGLKILKSQADRIRAAFFNPSVEKASPTRASIENNSQLQPKNPPIFPHYRACLPNPQFFTSSKLESMSSDSSETLPKINEYQHGSLRSAVKEPSLNKSASSEVADSSKPVRLGGAPGYVIRSTDSISNTGSIRSMDSDHSTDSVRNTDSISSTDSKSNTDSDRSTDSVRNTDSVRSTYSMSRTDSISSTDSVRSADSFHDIEGQRTDRFLADDAPNKASRGGDLRPRMSFEENRASKRKRSLSRYQEIKLEGARGQKYPEKGVRPTRKKTASRLSKNESTGLAESGKNSFAHREKVTWARAREWKNPRTVKREVTIKKRGLRRLAFSLRKLRCVVLGWGQTAVVGPGSDVLRHAKVPILSPRKCEEAHAGLQVTENMLCAGDQHASKDTCKGDSGGPLLCEDRRDGSKVHWTVVGVTSFGVSCGQLGVYTNVHRYTHWIKQTIHTSIH